jgi:aryl-alcohol dehydrogenase-like predicted oxidoreductase
MFILIQQNKAPVPISCGMEYTKLGSTGLDVSQLCLGTWRFNNEATDGTVETTREEAHDLLDAFAAAGGNFIDTANEYGGGASERWIGEWLDDRDREDYVVASKVFFTEESRFDESLSRKTIRAEIEGTLDRLGTDYVDIYYIHRWDRDTPIRETLSTLTRLVEEGKVHYIGASAMFAWQLTKARFTSDLAGLERFEVTQPRFNAADRPDDYLEVCADQEIAVCPYSALNNGFLTGKYADGTAATGSRADLNDWDVEYSDRQWAAHDAVAAVAEETAASMAQVAIRWLMDQREVTCVPIFGARTVEQVAENVGAVDVTLSEDQYDRIAAAYPRSARPQRAIGAESYPVGNKL